jgi:hypothetical protein
VQANPRVSGLLYRSFHGKLVKVVRKVPPGEMYCVRDEEGREITMYPSELRFLSTPLASTRDPLLHYLNTGTLEEP